MARAPDTASAVAAGRDHVRLAAEAAAAGRLDAWADEFLRGDGGNVPFADGLLLAPRWYHGPVVVPLAVLTRICGPEAGMQYPVPPAEWERRVAAMAASIRAGWRPPPLICGSEQLLVNDGNHRLSALLAAGRSEHPVVFWASSHDAHAAVVRRFPAVAPG